MEQEQKVTQMYIGGPPDHVLKSKHHHGEQAIIRETPGYVIRPKFKTDENGKTLFHENGSPIILTDENGQPIPDKEYPAEGGQKLWFIGCLYSSWGDVFPEAMTGINQTKRWFMYQVRALIKKDAIGLGIGLFFTPWKRKIRLLEGQLRVFVQVSHEIEFMGERGYFLEFKYYKPHIQEMITLIANFFYNLGVEWKLACDAAECFCIFFEYDNQYYYRVLDLWLEADKTAMMKHLRKEIKRLLEINKERENNKMDKMGVVGSLATLIFLHPKVKAAFVDAISFADFDRMRPDISDAYFCLERSDYNYGGRSREWRWNKWVEIHGGRLPLRLGVKN